MNKSSIIKIAIALAAVALAFVLGRTFAPSGDAHAHTTTADASNDTAAAETTWTCSMHPQVRQPDPGLCPICAMDLIPLTGDDDDADDEGELPRLRLSERAIALMHIQTAPVQRKEAYAELRLPGRIALDETRREVVAARFGGRVDRLFVDYSGIEVKAGEHLAEMYSPQLHGDQVEFLQTIRAQSTRAEGGNTEMAEAAQTRLRLLGLSEQQIDAIRSQGEPSTHLTYYSPASGTVLERMVTSGDYVETGTPMFMIADLSQVWVDLEAYESELQWLRYGQEVTIETIAFPGEAFTGRIANIDPEINPTQRTARVRVNLPNEQRKLKPGMLATGSVQVRVGDEGQVFSEALKGMWISPMHPEIVKEGPGTCDICGMDLVPAETLGYFATSHGVQQDPLVIPASAPLFTGERSIVYVRLPDTERPTFEARTVQVGNRLGDAYPVLSGLAEGDLVVTHGQFKIDSELQIRGRPSMMTAPGTADEGDASAAPADPRAAPEPVELTATIDSGFDQELVPLLEAYLAIVNALAADSQSDAQAAVGDLIETLQTIGEHRLPGDAHVAWMEHYNALLAPAEAMGAAADIEGVRAHLQELTFAMESTYVTFGGEALPPVRRAHCPMVEGGIEIDGAPIGTWLQTRETINNPYWGAAMLRCGEFHGELPTSANDL